MMQFKPIAILGSQELVLRLTYLTPFRLSLIKRHRTKGFVNGRGQTPKM